MPPKNMTSVARNVHIPSLVESSCCCKSSKCDSSSGFTCASTLDTRGLLDLVFVRVFSNARDLFEVVRGRRRGGLPLQAGGTPGVRPGDRPELEGEREVDQGQDVADR